MFKLVTALFFLTTVNSFAGFSLDEVESIQARADGKFDVKCKDGRTQIATKKQIMYDEVCFPETLFSVPESLDDCLPLRRAASFKQEYACPVRKDNGPKSVDILWAVDMSGSMEHLVWGRAPDQVEKPITLAADVLMSEVEKRGFNWKAGVIDMSLGMDVFLPVPSLSISSVFQKLTSGDATEEFFSTFFQFLDNHPDFRRDRANLEVIVVTDTQDQSTIKYEHKLAKLEDVRFHGIFCAKDLGCDSSDGPWDYAGSRYEKAIRPTGGSVLPMDSKVDKDVLEIADLMGLSKIVNFFIPLPEKVKESTISVHFFGKAVPRYTHWDYSQRRKGIVFKNFDFIKDDPKAMVLKFDVSL